MTHIKYGNRDIFQYVNTITCNLIPDKQLECIVGHKKEDKDRFGSFKWSDDIEQEYFIVDRVKIPNDDEYQLFKKIDINPQHKGTNWDIVIDLESNTDNDRVGPHTFYPFYCEISYDDGKDNIVCSSESL